MRSIAVGVTLALLCAPASPVAAQGSGRGSGRIVAIGDIHGEIDGFKRILHAAGLADANGRWTGGRAQLIQTGDYTDRGTGTRAVLDLLMQLEQQARGAGGRAFAVLGNHEVMNLIGDTRDVTREIFATFADANSEKKRTQAWEQYARIGAQKLAKGEPVADVYRQTREAWLTTHPAGYVEYREAFAPRGKYGAWLRDKPIVTEVNGNIFMHAGISPALAPLKLDDLNIAVRDEVRRLDRFVDRLVEAGLATRTFTLQEILMVAQNEIVQANALIAAAQAEGKQPDRGLATEPDDPNGGPFAALLAKYGAKRFVTGHTPQQNRSINTRFGGRVVLIDTGMLANYYKGRPAALEIVGDKLTAIYETERI